MQAQFIKVCRSKKAFSNELYIYQSSFPHKARLHEILSNNTLVLSKIDGTTYLDCIQPDPSIIIHLAMCIGRFHSTFCINDKVLCHWDNQPQNILWCKAKQSIYLVDFEDIRFAHPEADIAHLFLFWAEVMSRDEIVKHIQTFLINYKSKVPLHKTRWKQEYKKAKARFDRRRKKYNKKEPVPNPDKLFNRKYLSNLWSILS
jgi:hypothetical protein